MALRTTLVRLLDDLRAECRLSLNPAHNPQDRERQVKLLQRKQEWLWNDFAWPHLRVDRFLDLNAGQRYYDLSAVVDEQGAARGDLDLLRITSVQVRDTVAYAPMIPHIGAAQYATHDSELGTRAWPATHWRISEDEQMEIWPVPDQSFYPDTLEGRIKITGIRNLRPLIADDDRADLDDRLIVLHAAAEYLAADGAKDAQIKLDQANALYLKLRGQLMPRKTFSMFVDRNRPWRRGRPIAVYRPPGT
jgi:hypothetical protein